MDNPNPPLLHSWHYRRTSITGYHIEGPFTDQQLLDLCNAGKLSLTTAVQSETRTRGQWLEAKAVPAFEKAINRSKLQKARSRLEPKSKRPIPQEAGSEFENEAIGSSQSAHRSDAANGPTVIYVEQPVRQYSNTAGVTSMACAIIGIVFLWAPIVALLIGGMALMLGVIGLVASLVRNGKGLESSVCGIVFSLIPFAVGFPALNDMLSIANSIFRQPLKSPVGTVSQFDKQIVDQILEGKGQAVPREPEAGVAKQDAELLAKFVVTGAKLTFVKEQFSFGDNIRLEIEIRNDTGKVIKAVMFDCRYQTPGRTLPWHAALVHYEAPGGVEPGETAIWNLRPNMLSGWGGVKEQADAVFDAMPVDLTGPDDKSLLKSKQ